MPPRYVVFLLALICAVISSFALLNFSPSWMRGNLVAHTFQATARLVRVVPSSGPVGGSVSVPIELASQGDENAIGFSLTFDAAVLGNPMVALGTDAAGATININTAQAAQGRIGLALGFPANQKFPAGDRQIAVVTFSISANATFGPTTINFGDQPVLREASDVNANALPLSFSFGAVTITKGFEADVTPRPDGDNNGTVTVTDWVQIGRFVAGLDTAATGNEFQRADCAPRTSLGDGKISIIDWTQAGRYATGLDPIVPAGGPTVPSPQSLISRANLQNVEFDHRQSRPAVINARQITASGQLVIELDAQGIENSIGFSLTFNPNQWRFIAASAGRDAREAVLHVNARQPERGHVGFAMALPAGKAFATGVRQFVVCTFAPIGNSNPSPLAVIFGDTPVQREVADAEANFVTANFTSEGVRAGTLVNVSAASFGGDEFAPEQIVSVFGTNLAMTSESASTNPLPATLAGTRVQITDYAGIAHESPLFFVSPNQINYLIPAETAEGPSTVSVINSGNTVASGTIYISDVAPGLFAANADGRGIAAAVAMRIRADGQQQFEPITQFDASLGRLIARPLKLGDEGEQVYLLLFGTGLRRVASLSSVHAEIAGKEVPVLYAGRQGEMAGLDQVNLILPQSLLASGEADVLLTVDGKTANTVRLSIR